MTELRQCRCCRQMKEVSAFSSAGGTWKGLRPDCKVCRSAEGKRRYAENPRLVIDRELRKYQENPHRQAFYRMLKRRADAVEGSAP